MVVAVTALLLAAASAGLALSLARRLRAAEERLREFADPLGPDLPEVGTRVPSFDAVTATGERITDTDLAGGEEVLVAFLSASCESCRWDLPKLVVALGDAARRGPQPVVVLAGDVERRGEIRGEFEGIARLIDDDPASSLTKKFGVRGYPSLLRVTDGVVVQAGHTVGELAQAARG